MKRFSKATREGLAAHDMIGRMRAARHRLMCADTPEQVEWARHAVIATLGDFVSLCEGEAR